MSTIDESSTLLGDLGRLLTSPSRRWLYTRMTLTVMSLEDIEAIERPFLLADITWKSRWRQMVNRLPVAPQVTELKVSKRFMRNAGD